MHRARGRLWLRPQWYPQIENRKAETFTPAERKKLAQAAREGGELSESAWKRPRSAKKVTTRRKREIDSLLASVVTRERASDAL